MNNTAHTRNHTLDVFRLVACLFVIFLHMQFTALPRSLVVEARLLGRWVIPFFFMVSGYYFAASAAATKRANFEQMLGRLTWLFLLWSLIYIPVEISAHPESTIWQTLLSADVIYIGTYFHLWFLSSLIFGYVVMTFHYYFRVKYALPVLSVLVLTFLMLAGPYPLIDFKPPLVYNLVRAWLSVPFLFLGIYFYEKGFPSMRMSLILAVGGAILQSLEARFIYHQFGISAYLHQYLISTVPYSIGLTGVAFNGMNILRDSVFSHWGRDLSLGIYLLHPMIIFLISTWVIPLWPALAGSWVWEAIYPVLVLGICVLLLAGIQRWIPRLFDFLNARKPQASSIE